MIGVVMFRGCYVRGCYVFSRAGAVLVPVPCWCCAGVVPVLVLVLCWCRAGAVLVLCCAVLVLVLVLVLVPCWCWCWCWCKRTPAKTAGAQVAAIIFFCLSSRQNVKKIFSCGMDKQCQRA